MTKGLRARHFCEFLHTTAVDAGGLDHPRSRTNCGYQPAPACFGISQGFGVLVADQRVRHAIAEIHAATSAYFETAYVVERGLHERVHKRAGVIIRHWLKGKH